jgi:hypothetical protein
MIRTSNLTVLGETVCGSFMMFDLHLFALLRSVTI